jgi:hypothetical protein
VTESQEVLCSNVTALGQLLEPADDLWARQECLVSTAEDQFLTVSLDRDLNLGPKRVVLDRRNRFGSRHHMKAVHLEDDVIQAQAESVPSSSRKQRSHHRLVWRCPPRAAARYGTR